MPYEVSVGMEVHAELATRSKMFCRCEVAFGGDPNTRTCPVCLGLPGALPVPNHAAIRMVLRTALALECEVPSRSIFHRKNYFYPDLPKGFQTSQYGDTNPLGYAGRLEIATEEGGTKFVHIRRVHLEEDTGKLTHMAQGGSGVDFNRSGVPLMEIVSEFPPDICSAFEAKEYLVQLRSVLLYLGVCDGRMEEGSLRCEPNVSIREPGAPSHGTKTELKNLNSYRSVQLGVQFEAARQEAVLATGGKVQQETRGWNESREESFAMRLKEAENDYRYFPCPDLAPMEFDAAEIEAMRADLPELPLAKRRRYQSEFGLSAYDAGLLVADRAWAEFFEDAVAAGGEPKPVCNWMNADFAMLLNDAGISARQSRVTPPHLADLTRLISSGQVSGKMGKELFVDSFGSGRLPSEIAREKGASQISDRSALEAIVLKVLSEHPETVAKYQNGQVGVKGFLVGQVMKQTQGRANPETVQQLLSETMDR